MHLGKFCTVVKIIFAYLVCEVVYPTAAVSHAQKD